TGRVSPDSTPSDHSSPSSGTTTPLASPHHTPLASPHHTPLASPHHTPRTGPRRQLDLPPSADAHSSSPARELPALQRMRSPELLLPSASLLTDAQCSALDFHLSQLNDSERGQLV